jgi:hypothetical protein
MEPRIRVFISHSSHTQEAIAYREEVVRTLKTCGDDLEVLIDVEGLKFGDEWRRLIYTWLDQAHVAVILLSEDAAHSHWVDIELSILAFRFFRGQLFRLYIVLLTSDETMRASISGCLQFKETFQLIEPRTPAEAAARLVEALRDPELRAKVKQLSPPRPGLATNIAAKLQVLGFNAALLAEIRSTIPSWPSESSAGLVHEASLVFADELIGVDFATACAAIKLLDKLLIGRDDCAPVLLTIVHYIKPAWITQEDATTVAIGASAEPGTRPRQLAIPDDDAFGLDCLIRRARGRPLKLDAPVIRLHAPESEDTMASFKRQVHAYFEDALERSGFPRRRATSIDERLKRRLQQREADRIPVFIVFTAEWPLDSNFIDSVRTEFGTLTLMFVASRGTSRVGAVVPSLKDFTLEAIEQAFNEWDDVVQAISPAGVL